MFLWSSIGDRSESFTTLDIREYTCQFFNSERVNIQSNTLLAQCQVIEFQKDHKNHIYTISAMVPKTFIEPGSLMGLFINDHYIATVTFKNGKLQVEEKSATPFHILLS